MPAPTSRDLSPILPENTVESLYVLHGAQRPWVYWLSLLGVTAALGVLPLVPVQITVRSSGVVRTVDERIELKATLGGRVARVLVRDNDHVTTHQPLVQLVAVDTEERLSRNRALQREKNSLVMDLRKLTRLVPSTQTAAVPCEVVAVDSALINPVLVRERARFLAQYALSEMTLRNAERIAERTLGLAGQGILTREEREDARYAAARAAADHQLVVEQAQAAWQAQLHDEETVLGQLVSEEKRLEEELTHAIIGAPATGTVQNLIGLSPGANIVAGQAVGELSPDAPLMVETYVSPKDVGFLRPGLAVRLQIDAFPYTQWGLLDGVVESVGADAVSLGQKAVFKVLVQPVARVLHLRTGVTGILRKGMTLTARFVVGRRSLLHVLYEDASGWLGPQDRPSSP